MKLEFARDKNRANLRKHGISLQAAAEMDLLAARIFVDDRRDYGEARFRAYGWVGDRLHMLAFTMHGDVERASSLRKASERERKRYEQHARPG